MAEENGSVWCRESNLKRGNLREGVSEQSIANRFPEVKFQQDLWWRRRMLCSVGGTHAVTHVLALVLEVHFSCQATVELLFPERDFAEESQLTFFPAGHVVIAGNGLHDTCDQLCQRPQIRRDYLVLPVWILVASTSRQATVEKSGFQCGHVVLRLQHEPSRSVDRQTMFAGRKELPESK